MSVIPEAGRGQSPPMAATIPAGHARAGIVGVGVVSEAGGGVELVVEREPGCVWCERWDAGIGPVYPKTVESTSAPLREVDIRQTPDDIAPARRVQYTPTFLLLAKDRELAWIEGYPGTDFSGRFWPGH